MEAQFKKAAHEAHWHEGAFDVEQDDDEHGGDHWQLRVPRLSIAKGGFGRRPALRKVHAESRPRERALKWSIMV